ncbi:response regulator transcription factor [Streptomyces samsunensis]|uniref:Response regulator transcription factor n=2 Tax=Streptomyces TaxID=1883 RepID=A0ABX6WA34_STRMQ|nr:MULTISPECIES: response regulator transcription factor [Streptomyces]MYU12082.1 DNA-binding response regulator [Streptomyces sp. SID8361]AQA12640.1 response regulator [Streptomyces autolyticus]AUA12874.1 Transcriptional regulatory protein YehT [Streptomyces sp. M56]MCC4319291.1 response regulator transcription factor [Streptomyces malaysiensis]MCD9590281.1 response regulator transcription factor [Streptomyces sp. 8ZJF_21]
MHRVLVVERHPLVLSALADLVVEEPGLELSGIAGSAREAISLVHHMQPDVVLIDVDERSRQTPRLVRLIGELLPYARIVRLTAVSDPQMECLESPTKNPSVLKTAVPEFLRSMSE